MTGFVRGLAPAVRRGVGVLLVAVFAAVLTGGLLRIELQTTLHSFLPSDDPSVEAYDELTRDYGGDPVVVLVETEQGVLEGDQTSQLVRLEGELARLPHVSAVYGPGTLLNQIAGRTQDLLAELFGRRDGLVALAQSKARRDGASAAEVEEAGRRAQERFDARYAPLIAEGLPGGIPTLRNERFVQHVVFDGAGGVRPQWRFLVPSPGAAAVLVRPVDGLDAARTAALVERVQDVVDRTAPAGTETTTGGVPVMISAMAQESEQDAPRMGVIALAVVALVLGSALWLRRSRRWAPLAVTLLAIACTASTFGWAGHPLSLGVVAFASVMLGLGCYYPSYFAVGARRRTVLVVALATSASLGTMALSPVPLVRDLGMALALGVSFAAGLATLLSRWLADGVAREADTADHFLTPRPAWVRPVALLVVLVAGFGWLALDDLSVRSDVQEFAGGLPAYEQSQHLVDVLGSSGELAIVLRGPDTLTPEALRWQQQAHDAAVTGHGDEMRAVVSAPSLLRFLGRDPTVGQIEAAMRILPSYLTQTAIAPDRSSAVDTFGVRIEDLDALRELQADLGGVLPPPPAGYTAEVTGLPVVLVRGEQLIAGDRLWANLLGIGVAAGVLALGLRRRSDAARALAAGAVATGLGFAVLQVTGTSLNPITAALGALTAAVGCEFSVVLAEAARTGRTRLRRAVLIGAATSAAGYGVLVASDLGAVRDLGVVLTGSVVLALVSSWLVVEATVRRPAVPPVVPTRVREVSHV